MSSTMEQGKQSHELKPESPFVKSTHPHLANNRWLKYVIISTLAASIVAMAMAISL